MDRAMLGDGALWSELVAGGVYQRCRHWDTPLLHSLRKGVMVKAWVEKMDRVHSLTHDGNKIFGICS